MKKLFAITLLLSSLFALQAQQIEILKNNEDQVAVPSDWKERWFELSREEKGAVFADPKIDVQVINDIIEANRAKMVSNGVFEKAGGDEDLFGCKMWFNHNLINAGVLNGTNWTEFDGGCGAGQGVDAYHGPVALPFDFCYFGDTYNEVYINSKGSISFNAPVCDWTPEAFPGAAYDMIAGFWADSDFTGVGLCYYEVLDDAFVVTFLEVGYWPGQGNLRNSFQIIITDGVSSLLPPGYQAAFIYDDMNWTHGGVGGSGGCCGTTPATVGLDKATGTTHYQVGRFNFLDSDYNGAYTVGDNANGVNWLDEKSMYFKTCVNGSTPVNHPPVPTNNNALFNGFWTDLACDTLTVCLGESVTITGEYLSPEANQIVSLNIDLSGAANATLIDSDNGAWASFEIEVDGAAAYIGVHNIVITATDNGSPVGTTVQTFVVEVLDVAAPEIDVTGVFSICAGNTTEISVVPGDLDYYIWSSGCQGPSPDCGISYGGNFTVTAYDGQCNATESFSIDETPYFIPALTYSPSPFACFGDTVTVCFQNNYPNGTEWECFMENNNNFPCNFVSPPSELDQSCVDVGPGYYTAIAYDADGCQGRNIFQIYSQASYVPPLEFDPFCGEDELEPITFTGGFANPGSGNLLIYMSDPEGNYAGGSFLDIDVICDEDTTNYFFSMLNNGFFDLNASSQQVQLEFGCEVIINFVQSGDDDGNTSLIIYNCGTANQVYNGVPTGSGVIWQGPAACIAEPAIGTWTVDACPCNGTFSDATQFNTTFTPCDYGFYTLTFEEDICGVNHSFDLEYTSAPEDVVFVPGFGIDVCPGESVQFDADYIVLSDCNLDIQWTNAVQDANNPNLATYTHPGTYEDVEVEVTVTNGCGSDSYFIDVEANMPFNASLDDITLCSGGSVTLDPIDNDTPDVDYSWTGPGGFTSANPQITVNTSGTYTVLCYNECEDETVSAVVVVAEPWTPTWNDTVECDDDEVTYSIGNVPDGYTWCWGAGCTNPNEPNFTVSGLGSYTITIQVSDDAGCDTYVETADVIISIPPNLFPSPEPMDTAYVCPNEIETFDLGFGNGSNYIWTIDCPGNPIVVLDDDETFQVSSAMFPPECLEQFIEVTGVVTNICGNETETWLIKASLCPITAPNVISPNEDNLGNNSLILKGIEVYDHTELFVFDRWGNELYSNLNYDNKWRAPDVPEGTYYYLARMYDSTDQVIREIESSLTILR
jgi:hypothetical protein